MLIKEVVARYGDRVRYVDENYGASQLADRFGIKRYPVVFVGDALVAQPKDFGGWDDAGGKYAPWREPASQDRFKLDLTRAIDRALRGEAAVAGNPAAADADEIRALPPLAFVDVSGRAVRAEELAGRVVVVEFWATWCAPCRGTLAWLASVERKYGARVAVVAIALDSPEAEMLKVARTMPATYVVGATKELVAPFGDVSSVPTMFIFDAHGRTASIIYGAPADLHVRADRAIGSLIRR